MYRIIVKPDGKRIDGKMNWRVLYCIRIYGWTFKKKVEAVGDKIYITSNKPAQIGSYCNPRKLLNI
jgi:hypothetical protein